MGRVLEWAVAAVFVLFVVAVYAAAAVEVLGWLRDRLQPGRSSPGRLRGLWRRAVLSAAAAGTLCILWARFVEPNWPEVVHVRVESAKVRPGARPVRIVHLSDLHCEGAPRLEERLPALVAAEKPDAIVFTGDSFNSPAGLPVFRKAMAALAGIAPTFVVKGNWDTRHFQSLDRFGGTGVEEVDGRAGHLVAGTTRVAFAGVHYDHEDAVGDAVRGVPSSELLVFLYHKPDLAYVLEKRGVDLALVGHTHGGQVRLPFYGALVTLARFGKRFEAGLYEVGGLRLYVNRGLGCEGYGIPPIRFLCRPEITVIDVGPPAPRPRD
jgi:hypothetical protein